MLNICRAAYRAGSQPGVLVFIDVGVDVRVGREYSARGSEWAEPRPIAIDCERRGRGERMAEGEDSGKSPERL